MPAARQAAADRQAWYGGRLREIAAEHLVCPYYLAQELVRWADVVVADYHYFFDGRALLSGLAQAHDWKVSILVDEAHNLVERTRAMYSADLRPGELVQSMRAAPAPVRLALERLRDACSETSAAPRPTAESDPDDQALHGTEAAAPQPAPIPAQTHGPAWGPGLLVPALNEACESIDRVLVERTESAARPTAAADPLLEGYFALRGFLRLADSFGPHSWFDATTGQDDTVRICNVVPAPFIGQRFARVHSAVLFSGTLCPSRYEVDLLGLPGDTVFVEADAPFHASQLTVAAVRLSTRFRDRQQSVQPIARLIADQFRKRPGNYLAFFSSFAYLESVHAELTDRHPGIPSWRQLPAMSSAQRQQFLDRLRPGGHGVAFAVLGGSFAEGVDLPGGRLAGAFIATLGLPALDARIEAISERLDALFGSGFDYAYLIPGLRKVVQAAGRVVRSPSDRGVIYLIDPRYHRPEVKALLPGWWPPYAAA